jgi:hypothetical protein
MIWLSALKAIGILTPSIPLLVYFLANQTAPHAIKSA